MLMRKSAFVACLAVMQILIMCAAVRAADRSCDIADLRAVFDQPLSYAGKRFCGRAFMVREDRWVLFYPTPEEARRAPNDIALVPTPDVPEELKGIDSGRFIFIRGTIAIEPGCFTGSVKGNPHMVEKCTPIHRPIYILDVQLENSR